MKNIIKYWYVLALAFIFSLVAAFGLIYLRQDQWVPDKESEKEVINLEEGDSESFREWRFRANQLEGQQLKLDAREADLGRKEKSLNLLQAQIANERLELATLRTSLEELRALIEKDYITIEAQELSNLQRLASIYTEIKADAAIKVFGGLEDEEVVKILSLMSPEASAGVLGEMGGSNDAKMLKRAAKLTSDLRKVKR